MSSNSKLVSVFNYKDCGLTSKQKEELCLNLFENIKPNTEEWDFNRQFSTKKIIGYETFCVFERGHYYQYDCEECNRTTNLPMKINSCILCKSNKIKLYNKGVGQVGMRKGVGITEGVDPYLYSLAQKDLRENPVKQPDQPDIDWKKLESQI